MNYQQKCLDIFYASDVVNKELTFGCEVEFEFFASPDGDEYGDWEVIKAKVVGDGFYHDRIEVVTDQLINDDWKNQHLEIKRVGEPQFKIIGHPPQLQDWLALLETKYQVTLQTFFKKTSIFVGQDHANRINFNLTTGQPATEADWEALYELIK